MSKSVVVAWVLLGFGLGFGVFGRAIVGYTLQDDRL